MFKTLQSVNNEYLCICQLSNQNISNSICDVDRNVHSAQAAYASAAYQFEIYTLSKYLYHCEAFLIRPGCFDLGSSHLHRPFEAPKTFSALRQHNLAPSAFLLIVFSYNHIVIYPYHHPCRLALSTCLPT
jgi:hypothetical protein